MPGAMELADMGDRITMTSEISLEAFASAHEPLAPETSSDEKRLQRSSSSRAASTTHSLFPPLPEYKSSSPLLKLQWHALQIFSFILSLVFLSIIVIAALFSGCFVRVRRGWVRIKGGNPEKDRPFWEEERRRKKLREDEDLSWMRRRKQYPAASAIGGEEASVDYEPTEGGPDRLICDIAYYARRVGLDAESFDVQTEDGYILTLWHVYDRMNRRRDPSEKRKQRRKYPVLMIPGLLQGAGSYCVNDEDSLAFYLCKSGYDVWLGQNRCGFQPWHSTLSPSDPRFWSWNIRHMGIYDLPALINHVLTTTSFPKLALVAHSQGTTETLVALSKDQCPDLGHKISIFCALAPAAYASTLISSQFHLKFMRIVPPRIFRLIFGIHAFIPLMMRMHSILPRRLYGDLGYAVFSYLFAWSDQRWDRALRARMFMFSPVYVSAECMRWWLGKDGFATQKCILSTRREGMQEEEEDRIAEWGGNQEGSEGVDRREETAWFDERVPPFALWIAGEDNLVDGRRLLRRLRNGREPAVKVVHAKELEGYEHLDVLWAMDAVERVGREVRGVISGVVAGEGEDGKM